MKLSTFTSRMVGWAGVCALTLSLQAAETSKTAAASKKNAAAESKQAAHESAVARKKEEGHGVLFVGASARGGLLGEAYALMKRADHDYKGHRAHAMHEVAAAARIMGERLSGEGRAGEAQGTSDENLRRAQSLLQEAAGKSSGAVNGHVQEALRHLSIALEVR